MHTRISVMLLAALALVGCDRITGEANQKILDAEAIGYACRVSQKPPEDCMKENDAQSPSSVLDGWKAADKDIKENKINVANENHVTAPVVVVASSAPSTTGDNTKQATEKTNEPPHKTADTDANKSTSH